MPIQPKQQPPYYQNQPHVKTYVALITQTGTAVPTATVLQNTLGTITYERYGVGSYGIHTNGLLSAGKTHINGVIDQQFGGNDTIIPLYGNTGFIRLAIADEDDIYIDIYNNLSAPTEWHTLLGVLAFPTITVYP